MKRNVWAVICGSIRDELDFKLTLTRLVELRELKKIKHIVLSTWYGEIDKYEGLRQVLLNLKVYLLEVHPLSEEMEKTPSGSVNYWRQARNLLFALDRIPKHDFVLRVRTDRSLNYINQMVKLGVFEDYIQPVRELGKFPKIFEFQIIVFRPRTIRLFQMTDFVLMGQNRDLYKLINFSIYDLQFQKGIVANAQWFSQPFLLEFPILRDYMRFTLYPHATPVLKRYSDKNQSDSYFPAVYSKIYAIYLLILYTHFNILKYEKFNPDRRDVVEFHNFFNGSSNGSLRYQSLGTIIVDSKIVEYAVLGKMKPSKSYDLFLSYINKLVFYGSNYHEFDLSLNEYNELKSLVSSNFYESNLNEKWYRNLAFSPIDCSKTLDFSELNDVSKLNCLKTEDSDWKSLSHTMGIEKQLYSLWLDKGEFDKDVIETILLPIARTGNEYTIFILLDMYYIGQVKQVNRDEVIRIAFFYLDIKRRANLHNFVLSLISVLLFKISKNNNLDIHPKFLKFGIECIFGKSQIDAEENNGVDDLLDKILININKVSNKSVNLMFIQALILDNDIPAEVVEWFSEKNMKNELMISKFAWRNSFDGIGK